MWLGVCEWGVWGCCVASKCCSAPDAQVSVEPTVGGKGLLLSQGVVLND
jgi:hypothetical protein